MKRIIFTLSAILMTLSLSSFTYEADCERYEPSETQHVVIAVPENESSCDEEPTAETVTAPPIYTEQDITAIAQTLWGEARGCSLEDQKNVVRTICNRCDDGRFPDTPFEVVTQPYQYAGYSPNNPIDPRLIETAVCVLEEWNLMKQGTEGIAWTDYLWFTGNGIYNSFRATY